MSGACARELPALDVAAARGCQRCLGLLLRARERLALERGGTPTQEPGWPRRALSFLSEDGTDGSDSSVSLGASPGAGPLSSTRRSLLDEPGDRGVTALWPGWPQEPRGDPAVLPPPLASSTLLSHRDPVRERPPSGILGARTGGPSLGDIAVAWPQLAPGVSLRQQQRGVLGTRAVSPRSPLPRGGLGSCSVAPRTSGGIAGGIAGDAPAAAAQHCPVVPITGVPEPGDGDPAAFGDSSSFGDSTECFVSALESPERSEAGGAQPGGPPGGAAPSPAGEDSGATADIGGLLARLGGCSLRGSPPCSPRCLGDPGDVTARGRDTLGDRHVTPRSRSRLRGVAARLRFASSSSSSSSSSYSSSLFPESLPMPRRPPRLRVPRAAVTSPLGRCVTPGDRDVAAGEAEGTGGSWGDTQILPGLSPGGGSAPKSGPTVLLGPGDKGHPQNSSGSGPTVLLGSGDKGHPQDSLSLARGSPKRSPRARLVAGTRGHPQKSPSVTRGPLSATGMLEGGSGWQRPSPLGTSRSRWPHGSLKHPLAPRPPGSASGEPGTLSVPPSPGEELGTLSVPPSPGEELGTPSVPPSPAGCATPRSEGHPEEDVARAQTPAECHSPGDTDATGSPEGGTGHGGGVAAVAPRSPWDRSPRLWALGHNPGAVTEVWPEGHSPELVAALRTGHIPDCAQDELALTRDFERPERGRPWREGRLKSSFNYLLLDPRVTRDLPRRSPGLSAAERFRSFVGAVFYVGKGTRGRACWHLRHARARLRRGTAGGSPKVRRILEIWAGGHGVVPLQCFQHRVPAEAYTRESCMLEALGLQPLTNARRGPCYGMAAAWAAERRRRLGVLLLHRAMGVLLAEGERQLRPEDIAGGH